MVGHMKLFGNPKQVYPTRTVRNCGSAVLGITVDVLLLNCQDFLVKEI